MKNAQPFGWAFFMLSFGIASNPDCLTRVRNACGISQGDFPMKTYASCDTNQSINFPIGLKCYEKGLERLKRLVVYDSEFGNTGKIAHVIAHTIGARILPVSKVDSAELSSISVLVVGSPTHGGRPTPALQKFLSRIPDHALENSRVAAFDTRFAPKDHGVGLRILMKTIGFAAPRIAEILVNKGGYLACPPEGFIVLGKTGPLKYLEIERASDWAKSVVAVYEAV